jgi:SAM-dependent methyltransferase
MNAKDLFSANAGEYSVYRPDYPAELYDFIFHHVPAFECAWDCGTGNGQAAKVLATQFEKVYATDISEKQLANAAQEKNLIYSVSSAEKTGFPDNYFDLITVAQAAHWFRLDDFYKEVERVAKPNAILAIWGYGLLKVNSEFDKKLDIFYQNVIGPYWDPERRLIDQRYQTIPFPFEEIEAPNFYFKKQWSLSQLEGYLSTWSAVQKFIKANSFNPVVDFLRANQNLLGGDLLEIEFPLFMRIGRV